ncbi:MAG: acetolactate synthase small subunit [Clostridia bacterium]|nr:acetolactate synthase small subunit [Clostridia bacterium]MBQ7108207.1 acetolactate synthase small subunit [Clostridia bacterium]MBQ9919235.1 acetolactate synthase small subunit [Clostridia bacterium]
MEKHYLSVLVENNEGVLARISSLFCQRGFNIDSLTVSATDNPEISRITIVTTGDEASFRQIRKQTEKLVETKTLFPLNLRTSLLRELLLIKLRSNTEIKNKIEKLAEKNGAVVIDVSVGCVVLELTGEPEKIDKFLSKLKDFEIIEMCRTGVTAMERGEATYSLSV